MPGDRYAAGFIAELREERGLSAEGLANEIRAARVKDARGRDLGTVDAHTIRRIERDGHVPTPRVKLLIATFFGERMTDIWRPRSGRGVAA
jgi:transcriptional regulator with XRE-family HTH domain